MPIKYTAEMDKYLREVVPGRTFKDVTVMFNDVFRTDLTDEQIRGRCSRMKIRNGCRHGLAPGFSVIFTEAEQKFIAENCKGRLSSELTEMLNKEFGTAYKTSQIVSYKKNHHLRSGVDTRVHLSEKRYVPPKGTHAPGCEKGWFSKGNIPHNHVEVGTETLTTDGYIKVKIAEPNYWEFKHKLVWQEANGPIPPKHNVMFLDGDRLNCNLDNLYCIPRDEYGALQNLRSENPEITFTAATVVKLRYLAKKKGKSKNERVKNL